MSKTTEERNKALVLDAFNILFNKRDYEAAGRYWSPDYIQHSAHRAGTRGPLQPHQEHATDAQVRGGDDRG